ncbi:MAG: hypothetical protein NW223_24410 [Hyphomicrobiaceae bacterium]|nr:hypothetical protein [Hyphomicrobiaceae bacterium]
MATTELVPASDAAHAAAVPQAQTLQRFLVAGFPTQRADGTLDECLETQMQGAWQALFAAMKAAGFERHHLRNTTMYLKVGGQTQLFRRVRDRMLQRMPVPSACLHVSELETAAPVVEIEGQACKD